MTILRIHKLFANTEPGEQQQQTIGDASIYGASTTTVDYEFSEILKNWKQQNDEWAVNAAKELFS